MDFDFTLPQDYGSSSPKTDLRLPDGFSGVVLHSCCAPCSTAVLECLVQNGIKPVVFFFNPNIHPKAEYETRRDEWMRLCSLLGLEAVEGSYEPEKWLESARGLEDEPERGRRCSMCFEMRLEATARFAVSMGIGLFTTTLATSRWKSKPQVDAAGAAAAAKVPGSAYWNFDWRKEGLVGRRYQLVREIGFYNQRYCGCVYSMKTALSSGKITKVPGAENKKDR
jgi:predicted adenine nucleotide alpha hydrolase (AANH) superfamily ATPase